MLSEGKHWFRISEGGRFVGVDGGELHSRNGMKERNKERRKGVEDFF